jgi:tetratricopeptide (TPR) repeat protein
MLRYLLTIIILAISFPIIDGQTLRTAAEYNNRGLSRQRQGDLDGAIEDFTAAIERSSGMMLVVVYHNRGNARTGKSDWDGAIADYTKSLELQLDSSSGPPVKKSNNKDGGLPVFSGVIVAPPIAFTYNRRGNARKAKGDADGAIADYNKALEENPRYADAFYNRGVALQSKNDLDGAIKDYSTAVELAPGLTDAYVNRGQAKQSQHDLDGAIADYTRALELKADEAGI